MSPRDLITVGLALDGGFGGMVCALTWLSMVDELNRSRPADDQIPTLFPGWPFRKSGIWSYSRVRREFHKQFPQSPLSFWNTASFIWMYSFIGIALLNLLLTNR
ncbi:MAG TPA: hypothetical protein VEG64_09390 [Candidatus Sulfotelmatobacter sp.]|nr:hypothetical protein [Candidatus Sulfotelmatobacter sp.]